MVRHARLVAPLALAALSVVAALSLGRVVDSTRFVAPVVAAALLPHALGALTRWRSWPGWVGVLLSAGGLVAFVILALEPSTTTWGLPGAETWRVLGDQLDTGWHVVRTAPAPVPATDGAVLLAVLAVWCTAALADWLAFGRHTVLAAASPALVFFVWTSTLGTDDSQLLLTLAFCGAAATYVLAQHLALLDRRRSWLVTQHRASSRWLASAVLLGVGAVVLALVVTPMLPATGSDPLLDLTGAGRDGSGGRSYRPSLPPFVDIGRKLDAVDDVELFTVDSEVADYWRIAALDQYSPANGGNWTLSAQGDDSVAVGLPETAPADALQQEFRIGPLGERWLPAAYKPVAINLPDTLVVRSSDTIVADADSVSDLRYTVASELPVLSTSQVTAAQIAATDRPVPEELRRYTVLPRTADMTEIATRARRLVDNSGATTPYARALVLRDWFRNPANGFRYDTSVGSFDNGDAILQFLDDQRGFCVQFASAYAVMARSLGIPARVAVGFTPGRRDGNRFRVTSHDAHAWPEVYLSGLGWTHLFDPTPSARDTTTGGSALPNETGVAGTSGSTVPPPTVATAPPPTTPGASSGADQSQAPAGAPPQTLAPAPVSSGSDGGPWLLLLSLVALLAAAIGAYVGIVLTVKRHRRARRRGAGDPALAVTGAWHEALDRLHEASIDPRPEQTPLDVADALPARAAAAATDPMRALARTYGAARYGDGAVDPDDARDAWGSLEQLERALDADLSWRGRWRRRLDARTLVRR